MHPKTEIGENRHLGKAQPQVGQNVFLINVRVIGATSESLCKPAKFVANLSLTIQARTHVTIFIFVLLFNFVFEPSW